VDDDRDRHIVTRTRTGNDRRGLVVAEDDKHEIVVVVRLYKAFPLCLLSVILLGLFTVQFAVTGQHVRHASCAV
jgi:hypothetical protein